MKTSSILLLGTCGQLVAGRAPPPVPATPHVFSLEGKDLWKSNAGNWAMEAPEDRMILVNFFNPFCGHCRRMMPDYEEAARVVEEEWNQGAMIRFGRVNCDIDQKRCASYGISAYPTIYLMDGKGKRIGEFPIGLRRAANFLDFVAEQLRSTEPMPVSSLAEFEGQKKVLTQSCWGTTESSTELHHVCRSHQTNNVLLAGREAMDKIRAIHSATLSSHLVWEAREPFGPITSLTQACWLDLFESDRFHCIDTENEPDLNAKLPLFMKRFSNPRWIEEASWHHFFLARQQGPKSTMVVSLGTAPPEWQKALTKAIDNHREQFIVLSVDPASDLFRVFDQLQIRRQFPRIGALVANPESHLVFNFTGTTPAALDQWMDDIMLGRIKPSRPTWVPSFWGKIWENILFLGRSIKYGWLYTSMTQKFMTFSFLVFGLVGVYGVVYWPNSRSGKPDQETGARKKRDDPASSPRELDRNRTLPLPNESHRAVHPSESPTETPTIATPFAVPSGTEVVGRESAVGEDIETREPSPAGSPTQARRRRP